MDEKNVINIRNKNDICNDNGNQSNKRGEIIVNEKDERSEGRNVSIEKTGEKQEKEGTDNKKDVY